MSTAVCIQWMVQPLWMIYAYCCLYPVNGPAIVNDSCLLLFISSEWSSHCESFMSSAVCIQWMVQPLWMIRVFCCLYPVNGPAVLNADAVYSQWNVQPLFFCHSGWWATWRTTWWTTVTSTCWPSTQACGKEQERFLTSSLFWPALMETPEWGYYRMGKGWVVWIRSVKRVGGEGGEVWNAILRTSAFPSPVGHNVNYTSY